MRGWKKTSTTTTNNIGEFEFIIIKKGNYQIRWNPEDNIWPNTYNVKSFNEDKRVVIIHKVGLYKKRAK